MTAIHWSQVRGLRIEVHRSLNATTTGITASHDQLTVVGLIDETSGGKVLPTLFWRLSPLSDDAPPVAVHIAYRDSSERGRPPRKYAYLAPIELDPDKPAILHAAHGGNYAGGGPIFTDPIEVALGYPPGLVLPVYDHDPY
ncbi:hypothetical protein [Nocardia sp. NPDC020380]|uniref:hypothetical protein n=1 Tax=Nocardia sp. NPDC020380 TaxID=3364309 RepID=UPI0037B6D0B6